MSSDDRTLVSGGFVSDGRPGDVVPVGETIGRYVIVERVGQGAMGTVYAAYDPHLDRKIAIKVLKVVEGERGAIRRERAIREGQALARLSHPNVVTVFDAGLYGTGDRETVFVAMEFIAGTTLKGWLRDKERSVDEVFDLLVGSGRGLAAAHKAGLVHRDFKPENVLVELDPSGDEPPRACVTDFGLVAAPRASIDSRRSDEFKSGELAALSSSNLTLTGAHLGTPAYMAPEQFTRRPLDARADLFAFCVTAWEALYGEAPFEGQTIANIMTAVCQGSRPTPPQRAGVSRAVGQALVRGLSVDPSDRFASMEDLLAVFERPRRPGWLPFGLLAGAVVTFAGVVVARGDDRCDRDDVVADLWNQERSDAIHDAIVSTDAAHAERTWSSLEHAVDVWTERYAVAVQDACEGVDQVDVALIPRRDRCLASRHDQAKALFEALEQTDASSVQRALDMAEDLPSLAPCRDTVHLSQMLDEPPAERRDQVRALGLEVARLNAMVRAGKRDQALRRARELESAVEGVEYPPLTLALGLTRSSLEMNAGDGHAGRRLAERTYARALELGDDGTAARIALIVARFMSSRDRKQAALWVLNGSALARRARMVTDTPIMLDVVAADVESLAGNSERAKELIEEVTERSQKLELGPLQRSRIQLYLAMAVGRGGDPLGALETLETAYETTLSLLGPDHPLALQMATKRAIFMLMGGKRDEGAEILEDLVARAKRLGEWPQLTDAYTNLGTYYITQGRLDEATEILERAVALAEDTDSPTALPTALTTLAELDIGAGNHRDARPKLERAIRITEQGFGTSHYRLVYPLFQLSAVELANGRPDVALSHAERALEIATAVPDGEKYLGVARVAVGRAQLAVGALDRAEAMFESALALVEEHGVDLFDIRGLARIGLMDVELRRGKRARARSHLEQIRGDEMLSPGVRAEAEAAWRAAD